MPNGKLEWAAPVLFFDGDLRDLVRGGSGKCLISAQDMGDSNKPPGQTSLDLTTDCPKA